MKNKYICEWKKVVKTEKTLEGKLKDCKKCNGKNTYCESYFVKEYKC